MCLSSSDKTINITFIRHGTTIYNEQDRVQGSSDIKLSVKGINEIKHIQLYDAFDFDIFYHSPLSRSKDTLYKILDEYNMDSESLDIREDNLLTERRYGIFEGLTKKEIKKKYSNLYNEWMINENIKGDCIESIENVICQE